MSQSLVKINVHIVFSTKYRKPIIREEVREKLQAYMVGTAADLGSYVYELYANPEHVHILCTLPKTMDVADLVSKIKSSSSKWMKPEGIPDFRWVRGYFACSVSESVLPVVVKYILNQPEHHQKAEFQDEYRGFLDENGMEYDEAYVWD